MSFLAKRSNKVKQALQGPEGEFLLAYLLDSTGFYKQSFSVDPYQTAFNEGKRSVALSIIGLLDLREEDLRNLVRDYRQDMFNENE